MWITWHIRRSYWYLFQFTHYFMYTQLFKKNHSLSSIFLWPLFRMHQILISSYISRNFTSKTLGSFTSLISLVQNLPSPEKIFLENFEIYTSLYFQKLSIGHVLYESGWAYSNPNHLSISVSGIRKTLKINLIMRNMLNIN